MSIRVMTAVWDHAKVSGGTLLVLLAMSDFAHDDGTGVYPTQKRLAEKARMKARNLRNCLARLEGAGYIEKVGTRPGGVVEWRVEADAAKIAARQPIADDPGTGMPTEPLTEPPEEKADASPSGDELGNKGGAEASNTPVPAATRYSEPQSEGAAAAPWLVIELARLMRANDPLVKLPVGLRELMTPEYMAHYGNGAGFSGLDKRRELVAPVAGKPALRAWLDAARLLIDTDQRPAREITQVLRWTQQDDFEMTNVHSMPKLRKRYDQLRGKWERERGVTAAPANRQTNAAQLDAMARKAA